MMPADEPRFVPKEGWTTSLLNFPRITHDQLDNFWIKDASVVDGRPAGAVKAKTDGYKMFKDEHVRSVRINRQADDGYIVVSAKVKKSMEKGKIC